MHKINQLELHIISAMHIEMKSQTVTEYVYMMNFLYQDAKSTNRQGSHQQGTYATTVKAPGDQM